MLELLGLKNSTPSININLHHSKSSVQSATNYPTYTYNDTVSGTVQIQIVKPNKYKHQGIQIQLFGLIQIQTSRQNMTSQTEFINITRQLEPQGVLFQDVCYRFDFDGFDRPYESYYGKMVQLKYGVRIVIKNGYSTIRKQHEFMVLLPTVERNIGQKECLVMEMSVEDSLYIQVQYDRNKYYLKDCVVGRVKFILITMELKYMRLDIVRREIVIQGFIVFAENIRKYEVMDGCAKKGDQIPIRLYLDGHGLVPTMDRVDGKFSVKFYLCLLLVDEHDRRYFKQQEIKFYRKTVQ